MIINSICGRFVKKGVMEPIGVCDRTGFWFSKSDLVKEYQWVGDELVWNGLIVGRPFLDKPNEQFRTPVIKNDPHTVENPRPAPYEYPDIDLPSNNIRKKILEEVDFTKKVFVDNIDKPNIMGFDSSNISPQMRKNILNKIVFND